MQNYNLLEPVGQGQFGDEQASTLREAQLLSSLEHPNIIGYKECFINSDESLCIVTAFCEEGDLFKRIREKAANNEMFTEEEIMDMFIQIASSLLYIHSKKVLHRDLKTQNIFIAKGGIMQLGDFGIAKVLEKTDSFANTVTGTPYYMAPEICSSQPYTFKSDIWSLGCVLYELCTLKHAFAADSLLSLVYQIVRGNFPPIPKDLFSAGLSNLVNSLLVRDPNTRPTLQQVFQMPYVQEHVQRYHRQEKRRAGRAVQSATRRRQIVEEARAKGPDPGWETLTPKEKMAKKREVEAAKRELELKLASMNMNKDRLKAADRRTRMVHDSNIGLSGGGGGRAADPWSLNTMDGSGSMVNLATMPSSGGGQFIVDPQTQTDDWQRNTPGTNRQAGGFQTATRTGPAGGGDTVLMGSVMSGRGGGAFGGDTMVNLGTMNLGGMGDTVNFGTLPTLPGVKRPPAMPQSPQPNSPMPSKDVRFSVQQPTPAAKGDDYESDFASEYESDFEDYEEDDNQINRRMKIVSNVEDLGRTAALGTSGYDKMQEKVGSAVKTSKAQALRDRCQAALGYHFGEVYTFLRRARGAAQPPDEREVQKRLLDLVGGDKGLLPGCFMVDQLVFTESMFK